MDSANWGFLSFLDTTSQRMTPLRPRLNFEQLWFSDTLRPSLNYGDPVSPSQFGSPHHCSFILLVTKLVFLFLYNRCVLTSKAQQQAKARRQRRVTQQWRTLRQRRQRRATATSGGDERTRRQQRQRQARHSRGRSGRGQGGHNDNKATKG